MYIKYRVISFVLIVAILLSPISTVQTASAQNQAVECGTWSIKPASQKPKDSWIEIVLVSSSTTNDCSANFRIINKTGIETGVWDTDIGGYSFELTAIAGSSVTSWTEPWKPRGLAFLSPSLDAGMIATPLSKSSEAIITVHGDVTINSFAFDMALFVLGSVLTNAAGKTCLLSISEDQIQ